MADALARFDSLLDKSPLPFGAPAFDCIHAEAILPAFRAGIAMAHAEIEAIATNSAAPDFGNTIEAMERAGAALARVRRIFWALASARSEPAIRAIEAEVGAMLAEHGTAVAQDARLFGRVNQLWNGRSMLSLDEAQLRLLADCYRSFVNGGALLEAPAKTRLAAIEQELSALSTRFGQNVLGATAQWLMHLSTDDCAGLPKTLSASTAARASDLGFPGHIVTLGRGDVEAFLTFSARRDLREKLWRAFSERCAGGEHDNRAIVGAILALRQEKAALLGKDSFADHALSETMAGTPEAANTLLMRVWTPAVARAREEQAELQRLADGDGVTVEPWDWRYYAERVRRQRFALDGEAVKQFLTLDRVCDAAFLVAGELYGLTFALRSDLPTWHTDAQAWAVTARDGTDLGLLYTDFAARPEKHGGAWMGSLRVQESMDGPVLPIVYVVANFAMDEQGNAGLSTNEARTLFHEVGHALHALLSNVTYPSQSGTSVVRDFVEFPSKFMEHWIVTPTVLNELGMSPVLIEAIGQSEFYGQGFSTVEFVASALVDLALHRRSDQGDAFALADQLLQSLAIPSAIAPRHALTCFTHIFDGGYASQYYSYLWAEVLDEDAFDAFATSGDPVDHKLADRFANEVLARGDTRDPLASFVAFRGRPPQEAALLRARGFA